MQAIYEVIEMFVQFHYLSLCRNDFVSKQLVTENIHTPTIIWRVWFTKGLGLLEPYSHPSGNSSLACFLPYRILAFKILLLQIGFLLSLHGLGMDINLMDFLLVCYFLQLAHLV